MLKKILKLRLLYRNKNNIKQLYLNNYNKKDILTINAEYLNYSIIDKSNKYKLDNKLISINYHPGIYLGNTLNYNIRLKKLKLTFYQFSYTKIAKNYLH